MQATRGAELRGVGGQVRTEDGSDKTMDAELQTMCSAAVSTRVMTWMETSCYSNNWKQHCVKLCFFLLLKTRIVFGLFHEYNILVYQNAFILCFGSELEVHVWIRLATHVIASPTLARVPLLPAVPSTALFE